MNLRRTSAHPRRRVIGILAIVAIAVMVLLLLSRPDASRPEEIADRESAFVGGATCIDCHQDEFQAWKGSDHDKAMDVATEQTVLADFHDATYTHQGVTSRFYRRSGKFFVFTEGPDGEMAEFEVTHVFGHEPLQQYLVPFPGGRLQALNLTWDVQRKRWFSMYPDQDIPADDWLHWTRAGQNWNGMCAECHSTNLQKGYDPKSRTFQTTWTDIDVNCEACHGPGSRHVAWAKLESDARRELPAKGLDVSPSGVEPRQLVEQCAPCHARRAELGDYDHTGAELLDYMLPSLLEEGLYFADGQILDEVYVYGSFLQSRMYARGVSCKDCHDSHSLELRRPGNELCTGCHKAEVYDTTAHHFHKTMIQGARSEAAACVKCHMVERPYMVIDWRGDHSFRIPRPDLSAKMGTPNACTQSDCHADTQLQWSIDAITKWYGAERKPHFGTSFAAARRGDPTVRPDLADIALSDSDATIVRATALQLLGRMPGDEGIAVLRSALESNDPLERRTAAVYAPIVVQTDVDRLAALLSDPVKAVRIAAVTRLAPLPRERLTPDRRAAFDEALAEYRGSMSHTLDFASSAYNLGNLEANLGNPERAEAYYRDALAIDDLFSPARLNLAILLSRQGRNDEAETALLEILRDYPDNADALYSLGLLVAELGRPEEAAERLRRVTEIQPENSRARYNLGLLLQQQGRMDEAGSQLRRALEIQPEVFSYMHALADHLYRTGRYDQALSIAERMLEKYPDQPVGHQLKAAIERDRRSER